MKIGEDFVEDGEKVIHVKTFDPNPALEDVKALRHVERKGDWWHVGHIPAWMIGEWVKEAGISFNDTEAVREVVRKKLLSGEFNGLRPDERTF